MITSKDISQEINDINKEVSSNIKDPYQKASLKLQSLILKVLTSIRTNQTLIMEHEGIKKIEPPKRESH